MKPRIEFGGLLLALLGSPSPRRRPSSTWPRRHRALRSGRNRLRLTQLPFSPTRFIESCGQGIRIVKGLPQALASCAPQYHVHTASRASPQWLAQRVGSHDYPKWGARNEAGDYANPLLSGLHPIFLVFRVHPGMWVVRVEDFEARDGSRDPMSGVYLVMKDGLVTDQLNEGCELDTDWGCRSTREKTSRTLLPSGKFTR